MHPQSNAQQENVVKQHISDNKVLLLSAALLVLGCLTSLPAVAQAAPATTAVSSSATTRPAEAIPEIAPQKLLAESLDQAISGQFASALEHVRSAKPLDDAPQFETVAKLLADYLRQSGKAAKERAAEYDRAVSRIRRSMLAMDYLPQLAEAGIEKQLRDGVFEAAAAYGRASVSDELELATADEAAKFKTDAGEALDEAAEKLITVRDLLGEDKGKYAETFRSIVKDLDENLRKYKVAWAAVQTDSSQGRLTGAETLRELEETIFNSLADLETMIVKKPWRVGLGQTQMLVRDLATDRDKVTTETWYQAIKKLVEAKGVEAIDNDEWYDALRAYSGLSGLEPDNETYQATLKITRKHVRAIALYGEDDKDEDEKKNAKDPEPIDVEDSNKADEPAKADSEPASEPEPVDLTPDEGPRLEDRTTWREMVAGADPESVRAAITQLHQYYVSTVDYRKVGLGALESIQVLAEAPEAAKTFTGLADADLRDQFVSKIGDMRTHIKMRPRVDHVDILMVLNRVVRASEQTVKIPTEVLSVEFAEGMLDELDKHSAMVWPYDIAEFDKAVMGKFTGVGIQLSPKQPGEPLKVSMPLPGTPAHRQGIKAGDLIVAVDGHPTEKVGMDKLIRMIMGEKGTRVVLSIERPGLIKPKDVAIIRDEIRIRTVKGWRRILPDGEWDYLVDPDNGIAYIRVTQFSQQTMPEMTAVLAKLREDGVRSLIVDLRFNPGGILQAATAMADEFIDDGLLVYTRGRVTPRRESRAKPSGLFLDGDLVVLVNQYSASASEIVSGALKDWRRAIIIGERTYGKGSVQNVIRLSMFRQPKLKLTTDYYYLPTGRLLHRKNGSKTWGVDPDVEVRQTPKQLKRWLDIRRKTDLVQDVEPGQLTSDLAKQLDADMPLNTGVLMLRLMQLQKDLAARQAVALKKAG